jgi:vacuolar-type H+-ATPase subunit D/Vma8
MTEPAVRSRLLELRRTLERAVHGRDLLDRKREVILRMLTREIAARDRDRETLRRSLAAAAGRLLEAEIDGGVAAIDAAALAQPACDGLSCRSEAIAGVITLRLDGAFGPFVARYGPSGTTAAVDEAGAEYGALLPLLAKAAEGDLAVRALRRALVETTRRLKALENVVVPRLARTLREVTAAIEEDERAESFQRKLWLRRQADAARLVRRTSA